jgi:hypothetical protein
MNSDERNCIADRVNTLPTFKAATVRQEETGVAAATPHKAVA